MNKKRLDDCSVEELKKRHEFIATLTEKGIDLVKRALEDGTKPVTLNDLLLLSTMLIEKIRMSEELVMDAINRKADK